ncbi:Uncharacterised protein [Nocardia cyriacigeorgica]|uniref:Uncharacterized protein n=1 Tax=Nocardia cyriacigeorgica TaxID=135487 RepID=A0A4U8VS98_9NOCA|nr:Uncharacterised protein [Nocardia cyriacigeorgica]
MARAHPAEYQILTPQTGFIAYRLTGTLRPTPELIMSDLPQCRMPTSAQHPVITVVSGPPGSGKSTLARTIAEFVGFPRSCVTS